MSKITSKRNQRSRVKQGHVFPPSIVQKPIQNRTIRFRSSNEAVNIPIDRNCMLKILYATDLSGLRGNTQYSGVRLRRVRVWATPPDNQTAMISASIEWQSTRGPTTLISDTGNATVPAHIDTKPPKNSDASYWSQVSSSSTVRNEILFYITVPAGAVIDVSFSYVETNGAQNGTPTETLIIGTIIGGPFPDAWLINSLDNTTSTGVGTNRFKAVDVLTALGF